MLKKLFIGLIILSALTAEGIINAPWNIYDLCLWADNMNSFSDKADKIQEPFDVKFSAERLFSSLMADSKAYTESMSMARIKYDLSSRSAFRNDFTEGLPFKKLADDRYFLLCSFNASFFDEYPGLNMDIVFGISDVSPPTMI